MDDTIAIVLFVIGIGTTFAFARYLILSHKESIKEAQLQALKAEEEEKARIILQRERAERRTRMMGDAISNTPPKKRTFEKRDESTVPPRGKETTVTYAPSPTQSVRSDDSNLLNDIANIAIIANTVHHWNDNKVEHSSTPERSVGVTTKESSWGFDDSDSRKSVSSSMDSSPGYSSSSSSSSDSWSSSSDSSSSSGPSSDW